MPIARPPALVIIFSAWLVYSCPVTGTGRAHAQPISEAVVVPLGIPDPSAAARAAAMVEAELSNARVRVISMHDARDRFTARSRPAQLPSESDLDAVAREARDAVEHVAFGRTAAAQKSVREVVSRAERSLESLNRQTAMARHVLDACLSLVRTSLQTGKRDDALEQATRCRRLVPDLAPSPATHPASVIGVLAEADDLLARLRIGRLRIQSRPESECAVYLNGRHVGTTPLDLERAAAGQYRVQVECGNSPARVHVIQLGDEPATMLVNTSLDRAIASEPRLLLRYADSAAARESAAAHAVEVGREISVSDVVLVAIADNRAELVRVQVAPRRIVARVQVPFAETTTRADFANATAALVEGRIEGAPSIASPNYSRQSASPSRTVRILGRVLEPKRLSKVHPDHLPHLLTTRVEDHRRPTVAGRTMRPGPPTAMISGRSNSDRVGPT